AVAPGQLEVDLVLEEHRRLAEQPGHRAAELVAVAETREAVVEGAEVSDPLKHALVRTQQARLVIFHGSPAHLGLTLELVGPRRNPRDFLVVEQSWDDHEAVALEGLVRRLAHARVNLPCRSCVNSVTPRIL